MINRVPLLKSKLVISSIQIGYHWKSALFAGTGGSNAAVIAGSVASTLLVVAILIIAFVIYRKKFYNGGDGTYIYNGNKWLIYALLFCKKKFCITIDITLQQGIIWTNFHLYFCKHNYIQNMHDIYHHSCLLIKGKYCSVPISLLVFTKQIFDKDSFVTQSLSLHQRQSVATKNIYTYVTQARTIFLNWLLACSLDEILAIAVLLMLY